MFKKLFNDVCNFFNGYRQSYTEAIVDITKLYQDEPKKEKGITPFVKIEFKIPEPTEDEIRYLAYQKWEAAQPSDRPSWEFWHEAELELKGHHHENISQKNLLSTRKY